MTKKETRRMRYLMSLNWPHVDEEFKRILADSANWRSVPENTKQCVEIFELAKKAGMNDAALKSAWTREYFNYRRISYRSGPIYGKMPKIRQDNKTSINYGSGSGSWPTIRYPKKCRKTAWKRFYRLFPKLDPKNQPECATT